MQRTALTSFLVLSVLAVVLAVGSMPAAAQVAPVAIGPAVAGGQAAYSITARGSDVCVAVYLLDDAGDLSFVRYRLAQAYQTVGVVTSSFVPVFVTFQPVAAPFPVQRCSGGPTAGNLVTDATLLPKIYVVFSPGGPVVDINNQNFAAIIQIQRQQQSQAQAAAQAVSQANSNTCGNLSCAAVGQSNIATQVLTQSQIQAQLQAQFAAVFQPSWNNVNVAVGFGGFDVPFENSGVAPLLAAQATCGAPYFQDGGAGSTCSIPLQGGATFSTQSF